MPLDRTPKSPVEIACATTAGICALPSIATVDWCDRAAATLVGLVEPSIVAVGIGPTGPGEVGETVIGVAAHGASMALDSLRQALTAAVLAIPPPACDGARVVRSAMLAEPWEESRLGLVWDGAGVREVLLGWAPILGRGRLLTVHLGAARGAPGLADDDERLLAAVLPLLAQRAGAAMRLSGPDPGVWLTGREQDVLRHLLMGRSVRAIAQAIERSPHTVHGHVKSLHRKLGARSRAELIVRALGLAVDDGAR